MPRLSTIKELLDEIYLSESEKPKKRTLWHKKRQGIIIRGSDYVKKIAMCVNATNETIKKARDIKADFLLAHNFDFDDAEERSTEEKLACLKKNRITLYATGILMDRAYVYGTDFVLARSLGLKSITVLDKKNNRGIFGTPRASTCEMFLRRINWLTHEASEAYQNNSRDIRRVAIYAGMIPKKRIIDLAEDTGCDTLLCNTADFATKSSAKDHGMNLFIANYTATEILGLKALKNLLEEIHSSDVILLGEAMF